MQLTDIFCYVILTITMTVTCTQVESRNINNYYNERRRPNGLNRRDATIIMNEAVEKGYHQRPKVIYKKVARINYSPTNPKYGPTPPKFARKNRKQPNSPRIKPPKYRPNLNNKRSKKGRYPSYPYNSKKPLLKPIYRQNKPLRSKKRRQPTGTNSFNEPAFNDYKSQNGFNNYEPNDPFYKPESTDLIEPKENYGYGEPPVDSYGAPITPNLHDLANPNPQNFPFGDDEDQEVFSSNNFPHKQAYLDLTKPAYDSTPDEEMALLSYSDVFNYKQRKEPKKKSQNVKFKNQWKAHSEKERIVGGQYAEPPARYVPLYQPSAPTFIDDSEFAPLGRLSDPESVESASTSPYVNYKHSNMAFSPQNLNDAFGIVN